MHWNMMKQLVSSKARNEGDDIAYKMGLYD